MIRPQNPLFVVFLLALVFVNGLIAWAQNGLPPANLAGQGAAQPAGAAGPLDAATYGQQVSYMLGQNVGNDLRENQIDVDLQTFFAGVSDALRGAKPKWSDAELQVARQRFEQEMSEKMASRRQQIAARNAKQAEAFCAQNGRREGVQVMPSGLQYRVLRQGNGATPTQNDTVRCHYRGTLIDGTEFESSYGGEAAEFQVGEVIAGWTEALQKMRVGDKWQLFVPPDLAYGVEGRPGIEPNSLLIFEVELLGIAGR